MAVSANVEGRELLATNSLNASAPIVNDPNRIVSAVV